MRIIPAIDIIDGQCVRLTKGDYSTKTVYSQNPLEIAKQFQDSGLEHLHLVDLDGAKAHHIVNHNILETIATKTNLKIDFGGGLKSDNDLRIAFESGAHQITGGSIAVKQPHTFESWINTYGSNKIILGADCIDGAIAVQGWQETSSLEILSFINQYTKKGVSTVICTDISKDGMLQGPAVELYSSILKQNPTLKLIASGGVSDLEDLHKLQSLGCEGVIIGKAIYEGTISLKALKNFKINSN